MDGDKKNPGSAFEGSSLDSAFGKLGGRDSEPPAPSILEEPFSLPAEPDEGGTPIAEQIMLESKLLERDDPHHRKEAADTLVELAGDKGTHVVSIHGILDTLVYHNMRLGGQELSSQIRKVKRILELFSEPDKKRRDNISPPKRTAGSRPSPKQKAPAKG